MELTLYHAWTSSASRKVRLALHEKGLHFEERVINLARFEHHEGWYKALNPSGIVPALLASGRPLVESNLINEWLDETFPDPPLMPLDPFERHDLRLWAKFAREWTDAELEARLAAIPTEGRRAIWRRMARDPFTAAELEAAADALRDMMDRIETRLGGQDWLASDSFGLADIAAAPYVVRFTEIAPGEIEGWPRAAVWWSRVRARPSYAAAVMEPFV